MKNLFPSLKSRHTFFGFHRVYGMQNDQLDVTVILAESSKNSVYCRQRRTRKDRGEIIQGFTPIFRGFAQFFNGIW